MSMCMQDVIPRVLTAEQDQQLTALVNALHALVQALCFVYA